MSEPQSAIVVTTTTGDRALAEQIAVDLVDRRLAACVQIDGPITSVYRWEGEIERSEELRLSVKTVQRHLAAVTQSIESLHNYDVPEVVAVPVVDGSTAYLAWIEAETS